MVPSQSEGMNRDVPTPFPSLVLASGSPRRRELLAAAGLHFEVDLPEVEEVEGGPVLAGSETALVNAWRKARAVSARRPDELVVAADTVVHLEGRDYGKPRDRDEAAAMLRALSGKTHEVFSAVALILASAGIHEALVGVSRVTFRPLGEEGIRAYVNGVDCLDKAGAYAIQERGEDLVLSLEGDRDTVIGLPVGPVLARIADIAGRRAASD